MAAKLRILLIPCKCFGEYFVLSSFYPLNIANYTPSFSSVLSDRLVEGLFFVLLLLIIYKGGSINYHHDVFFLQSDVLSSFINALLAALGKIKKA